MSGPGRLAGPAADLTVPGADAMRALGRRLARLLRAGDLVILSGALGAGKTTLVQGIGEGLGVRGPVTSPTFVIARVHPPVPASTVSASTGPASTGPGVGGQAGAVTGLAADQAGQDADPAADTPRTVRISMVGARWEGVELPLAGLADRL